MTPKPMRTIRNRLAAVYCIQSNDDIRQESMPSWVHSSNTPIHFVKPTTPVSMPPILNDGPIHNRISEVAALISHLRTQRLISNQLEPDACALVIELGSIVTGDTSPIPFLPPLPDNWEILQLGTTSYQALQACLSLSNQSIPLVRWEYALWGAFAYLIRQPAAQRLSNQYLNAEGQLDIRSVGKPGSYMADTLIFSNATTYSLTDPVIGYQWRDNHDIRGFHRTDSQSGHAADIITSRLSGKSHTWQASRFGSTEQNGNA